MAIKNYMINDKWLDIAKQNIVEVESTDGVIGSVKVNGEEYGGGGGGSSDLSTAEVTSSENSEENIGITAITEIAPNKETVAETSLSGGRTGTAVLYQGHQYVHISPVITVTVVSGSAEVVEEIDPMFGTMYFLDIKGDCTIFVKPSE